MALAVLAELKTLLGETSSGNDGQLTQLLAASDSAVKTYTKREFEQAARTEFYSGHGRPELALREWPVTAVASVHVDQDGAFGDGPDPFPAATLLVAGTDYVLHKRDAAGSHTGLLLWLGGSVTATGDVGWHPQYGHGQGFGGSLSARRRAGWTPGLGNIKVVYTAGYATPPDDLKHAVLQLAAHLKLTARFGGTLPQSEGLGSYNYSLAAEQALRGAPALGSTRGILSNYRRVVGW